jgi:hypothetical protein
MVFDFSVTSGTIYVDGNLPTYDLYRLRLVSMYNNKGIENTIGEIQLTRLTGTTRYSVFTYDFTGGPIADTIDQDSNGYYMAYFEGAPPSRVFVELAKYPAKVKTQFTESYPEQYVSPNEDNEQYVYYRS